MSFYPHHASYHCSHYNQIAYYNNFFENEILLSFENFFRSHFKIIKSNKNHNIESHNFNESVKLSSQQSKPQKIMNEIIK